MVITKRHSTRISLNYIRTIALVALLIAAVGCSHKRELVYDTSTTTTTTTKSERRVENTSEASNPIEQAYGEKDIPILRENYASQIFRDYGVNPTISTSTEQYSTFAMDVDTVSYQLAKASLESYRLPNLASIRVEEFVNNFTYNYASGDDVLSISAEVVPSPYRPGFHLLHVGVKAKHVSDQQRLPANLVLVADVSGSMASGNKMALQKRALTTLVSQLGPRDSVAIVSYDNNAKILLKPTKASHKNKLYQAIQRMQPGSSTNVELGLQTGYALAEKMSYPGHLNRVVLTSDGMANTGSTSPDGILQKIEKYRQRNIFLTTVGVGANMYNDYLLEQLANKGNGSYLYFSNQKDIDRVFVDGLTQQLQVVAKDAKVQLKFNPEAVTLFRQIGYENRGLQTQDFMDASKDGGEIGANQQVTVLYEIKLNGSNASADLAKVALSYKKPRGSLVFSLDKSIPLEVIRTSNQTASSDTMISMAVAAFAEKLRQSYWSRTYSYQQIQSQLQALPMRVKTGSEIKELIMLVERAAGLDVRQDPYSTRLPLSSIDYDRVPLLR